MQTAVVTLHSMSLCRSACKLDAAFLLLTAGLPVTETGLPPPPLSGTIA